MTNRLDAARGRHIVARWCRLAEQRLEHLTELFESGRWRRYHSEPAFLENIREARKAVETWRDLLAREDIALDISRLSQRMVSSTRSSDVPRPQMISMPPKAVSSRAEKSQLVFPPAAQAVDAPVSEAPAVLAVNESALPPVAHAIPDVAAEPLPDIAAIQRRYPLLRNAL